MIPQKKNKINNISKLIILLSLAIMFFLLIESHTIISIAIAIILIFYSNTWRVKTNDKR